MKYTHFVMPEFDCIGQAGEVHDFDEEKSICILRLNAMRGISFVAVVDKKALKPMEVRA